MIKPTVGRKVWYKPSAHDMLGRGGMAVSLGQPLDATIIAVWGDRCVNVLVTDIAGKQFALMSVTLRQEEDGAPTDKDGNDVGGYVYWMPYQQGQTKQVPTATA